MMPDLDRMTDDLGRLVAIPSINPYDAPAAPRRRETEMADWLERAMQDIGLETGRRQVAPGRPNVWGRLAGGGGGPCLMLAGHMDTVDIEGYRGDPFGGEVRDGRLFGRGACDMKAALAVFLEVARVLQAGATPLAGDLLLMFVADEEHVMIGSRDAGRNGPHADFCIVGEPTELGVCPAHKGQICLEITAFGAAVHSSMPELGENAIARMNRVIDALEAYPGELLSRDPHPLCGHARFSPVMIRGGQSHSAIPERCDLLVDRRTLPGETAQSVAAEIGDLLQPLARDGIEFEISHPILDVAPLDTPAGSPFVTACKAAVERTTGANVRLGAFPGGTDAPNFGCPAVVCGPGALAQAHTADEYVELDQLSLAAAAYLDVARAICGSR